MKVERRTLVQIADMFCGDYPQSTLFVCRSRSYLMSRPATAVDAEEAVLLARKVLRRNVTRMIRNTTDDLRQGRNHWVYG